MKIISFIEEIEIIEMILRHLGLWDIHNHDPPPATSVYIPELIYDDSDTQIPRFQPLTIGVEALLIGYILKLTRGIIGKLCPKSAKIL